MSRKCEIEEAHTKAAYIVTLLDENGHDHGEEECGSQAERQAMTPPSIAERLRELANHLPLLERNGYPESALRSLAGEIEEVESEKLQLIGYISTLGPHINQHPEHILQWWNKRRASRLAAPEDEK